VVPRPPGDLVRAAAAGDGAAFAALVDRFAGMVWHVARAFRLNDADSADVSQSVWLRLATHIGGIREPDTIGAWLRTTAQNECLSLLRRTGRMVPVGLDVAERADSSAPGVDVGLIADERRRAYAEAFSSLPPRCQALFRLLAADPAITYPRIAEILDIPQGSLGPTRLRCIERVRRHPAVARIRGPRRDSAQ
jgi:RNA polymerase sigma factor (sigma-70 family)